jgi:hypothetical protein
MIFSAILRLVKLMILFTDKSRVLNFSAKYSFTQQPTTAHIKNEYENAYKREEIRKEMRNQKMVKIKIA